MAHLVELPHVQIRKYCDPPDEKGQEVQFRLIYRGKLPAARWEEDTRRKEKHAIRKVLHKQLTELWKQNFSLLPWLVKRDIGGGVLRSKADSIA